MTRYAVEILRDNQWEGVALFSDKAGIEAMTSFCLEQFNNGNSLTAPCESIRLTDMDTGELLFLWPDWCAEDSDNFDDDFGFDPYSGCYTFDC